MVEKYNIKHKNSGKRQEIKVTFFVFYCMVYGVN